MTDAASYYCEGSQLLLQLATGNVSVTIVKSFLGVSIVLLVLMNDSHTVIKIYDCRFFSHREELSYPWRLDLEVEAAPWFKFDPDSTLISTQKMTTQSDGRYSSTKRWK
jgi:hypothetical protein